MIEGELKLGEFGLTCCRNGFLSRYCDGQISAMPGEAIADFEVRASAEGWVIGVDDEGQGHYACPLCAETLFCALPIRRPV